jgi:hypothetical protein
MGLFVTGKHFQASALSYTGPTHKWSFVNMTPVTLAITRLVCTCFPVFKTLGREHKTEREGLVSTLDLLIK